MSSTLKNDPDAIEFEAHTRLRYTRPDQVIVLNNTPEHRYAYPELRYASCEHGYTKHRCAERHRAAVGMKPVALIAAAGQRFILNA